MFHLTVVVAAGLIDRGEAGPEQDEAQPEHDEHDGEHHQDGEEFGLGDPVLTREDRRDGDEEPDATDAGDDRDDRPTVQPDTADAAVHHRRDHQRDRTQRLDEGDRGEGQTAELQHDREPEHDRSRHPGRSTEEGEELGDVEPRRRVGAARRLDLRHASVLQLRAEREEDSAEERERDTEELRGVAGEVVREVGDVDGGGDRSWRARRRRHRRP